MKAVMDAREFMRVIKNTKLFAATSDYHRTTHQFIRLEFTKGEKSALRAYAINGYMMSTESAELDELDESFSALIKPFWANPKKMDLAHISLCDGRLIVEYGDQIIGFKQPEQAGERYDYERVLLQDKQPVKFKIGFNKSYLMDTLRSVETIGGQSIILEFRGSLEPLFIHSALNHDDIKLVLPVRIRGDDSDADS